MKNTKKEEFHIETIQNNGPWRSGLTACCWNGSPLDKGLKQKQMQAIAWRPTVQVRVKCLIILEKNKDKERN